MGAKYFNQLRQQGKLIGSSPYYVQLNAIARRIIPVAQPAYDAPFRFFLVRDAQPNAFSVPGGAMYVNDSMMQFAGSQEELAGVICHEIAHTIHHDVVNNARKNQTTAIAISLLGAALGADQSMFGQLAENVAYNMGSLHFSREVETKADLTGSEICARAGYNPYGMIWLFQRFTQSGKGSSLEILADHPNDGTRIKALQKHFSENPALFARFSPDKSTAKPLGPFGPAPATPLPVLTGGQ